MLETYLIYVEEKINTKSEIIPKTACCKHPSHTSCLNFDLLCLKWYAHNLPVPRGIVTDISGVLISVWPPISRGNLLDYKLSACVSWTVESNFSSDSEVSSMIEVISGWSKLAKNKIKFTVAAVRFLYFLNGQTDFHRLQSIMRLLKLAWVV